MSRITPTLALCTLAAAVAVALLWLPPRTGSSPDPAYAPAAAGSTTAPSAPDAATDDSESVAAVSVSIANFAFTDPGQLTAGQEVVVTNNDGAPHTLTATDGSFDTGLLQPGESAVIVMPATGGEFAFFCELHPSMTGLCSVAT